MASEIMEKYFGFQGRAGRREYWLTHALSFLCLFLSSLFFAIFIGLTLNLAEEAFKIPTELSSKIYAVFYTLFSFVSYTFYFIFTLPVNVRRLHDLDERGLWILAFFVPLMNVYFLLLLSFRRGSRGKNRFGPPLGPQPVESQAAKSQTMSQPPDSEGPSLVSLNSEEALVLEVKRVPRTKKAA